MVSLFSYQQQIPLLSLLKEEKLLLRKILKKIAQGLVGNNLGQGYVFMKKALNENTLSHTHTHTHRMEVFHQQDCSTMSPPDHFAFVLNPSCERLM